jgi:putative toxin-antitoxin system antitoxin component (TIGR02293 family)
VTVDAADVARIMGGEKVLRRRVASLADLQAVVAEGLPVRALNETVRHVAGSSRTATALKDRLVPRATRARRTRLKLTESERVERLARVMALAEHVWANEEDARAFMQEPHPLLDGETPLAMASTELGARRVELLLSKLEYGLPV